MRRRWRKNTAGW